MSIASILVKMYSKFCKKFLKYPIAKLVDGSNWMRFSLLSSHIFSLTWAQQSLNDWLFE